MLSFKEYKDNRQIFIGICDTFVKIKSIYMDKVIQSLLNLGEFC